MTGMVNRNEQRQSLVSAAEKARTAGESVVPVLVTLEREAPIDLNISGLSTLKRFKELKIIEGELDINQIDEASRTPGVQSIEASGKFRLADEGR